MTTPLLGLTEGADNQAQPFTTVINPNLRRLEVVARKVALSFEDSPPGSPADGEVHVVSTGSGAFEGHDAEIAYRVGTGWQFYDAAEGEIWAIGSEWHRRTDSGWAEIDVVDAS